MSARKEKGTLLDAVANRGRRNDEESGEAASRLRDPLLSDTADASTSPTSRAGNTTAPSALDANAHEGSNELGAGDKTYTQEPHHSCLPVHMGRCPYCNERMITVTRRSTDWLRTLFAFLVLLVMPTIFILISVKTEKNLYLIALLLVIIAFCLPPRRVDHSCGKCERDVGTCFHWCG